MREDFVKSNIPYRLLHKLYLEYPFAKCKAYRLETEKDNVLGIIVILIKNRRTNLVVASTTIKEEDVMRI